MFYFLWDNTTDFILNGDNASKSQKIDDIVRVL